MRHCNSEKHFLSLWPFHVRKSSKSSTKVGSWAPKLISFSFFCNSQDILTHLEESKSILLFSKLLRVHREHFHICDLIFKTPEGRHFSNEGTEAQMGLNDLPKVGATNLKISNHKVYCLLAYIVQGCSMLNLHWVSQSLSWKSSTVLGSLQSWKVLGQSSTGGHLLWQQMPRMCCNLIPPKSHCQSGIDKFNSMLESQFEIRAKQPF